MSKKESGCSFCGRPRAEVGMLIAGVTGHICESCVSQAHTIVKEEDLSSTETKNERIVNVLKPLEIKEKLDEYVIGQKFAKEIFIEAVKNMSIKDAMSILKGNDKAATFYLKEKTSKDLYVKFKPVVKKSIEKVKLTKHWNTLSGRYNALPMTTNVNPDLEDYITTKAINGLFLLIAKEEKSIRNNPKARVSEILQKVFK